MDKQKISDKEKDDIDEAKNIGSLRCQFSSQSGVVEQSSSLGLVDARKIKDKNLSEKGEKTS